MTNPAVTLVAYQFFADDSADPDTCSTLAGQGTPISRGTGTDNRFLVRFRIDETNGKNWGATVQLEYENSTQGTGWNNVTGSSSHVQSTDGLATDGVAIQEVLTGGTGTYTDGAYDEGDGLTPLISVAKNDITEVAYCVYITTDAASSDTINLRATVTGVTTTYTATASLTVAATATTYTRTASADALLYGTAELTASVDAGLATVGILSTASLDAHLIPKPTRFWDEKFEGTGYEESWSEGEDITGTSTINEDYATSSLTPAAPSDWDSQCLEIVHASASDDYNVSHIFSAVPRAYFRIEFMVGTDLLTNGQNFGLSFADSTAGGIYIYYLYITKNAGQLQLELTLFHDGTSNIYSANISTGTYYRFELKWDTVGDTWEWRLDGATQNSGSLTGGATTATLDQFWLGGSAAQSGLATVYYDNVAMDDTDWLGSEGAASVTKTTSLNAALLRQKILRTASLDAALQQAANLNTTDLDAVVAGHTHLQHLVDAAVRAGMTNTAAVDAALAELQTATTTLDAAVALGMTAQTELDAVLAAFGSVTTALDAALERTGTTQTDLDGVLRAAYSVSTALEAAIVLRRQQQTNLDAALVLTGQVTSLADAVLRALVLRTTAVDAHLIVPGAVQLMTELDAAIRAAFTVQTGADAAIAVGGIMQQAIDAVVAQMVTVQTDLDAAVQANIATVADLDAHLILQLAGTRTANVDAALQRAQSVQTALSAALAQVALATVTFDAVVQAAQIRTANVDAHLILQVAGTLNANFDAVLRKAYTQTTALDARLELGAVLRTVLTALDAAIAEVGTTLTAFDAVLRKVLTVDTAADAALQDTFSVQTDLDAIAAVQFTRQLSIDSALARYGITGVAQVDAKLLGTGIAVQTALDARLSDLASPTPGHRVIGVRGRNRSTDISRDNRGNVRPYHRLAYVDRDSGAGGGTGVPLDQGGFDNAYDEAFD